MDVSVIDTIGQNGGLVEQGGVDVELVLLMLHGTWPDMNMGPVMNRKPI